MNEPVMSFDSIEEAQAFMANAEEQANARLHPKQIELRDRSEETVYWVRPYEEFFIFGETPSVADNIAIERTYYGDDPMPPEEVEEFEYIKATLVSGRQRGYLNGRCYSIIEPTGELGNTHVANAWPISKESFEEAKAADWEVSLDRTPTLVHDLQSLRQAAEEYRQ